MPAAPSPVSGYDTRRMKTLLCAVCEAMFTSVNGRMTCSPACRAERQLSGQNEWRAKRNPPKVKVAMPDPPIPATFDAPDADECKALVAFINEHLARTRQHRPELPELVALAGAFGWGPRNKINNLSELDRRGHAHA